MLCSKMPLLTLQPICPAYLHSSSKPGDWASGQQHFCRFCRAICSDLSAWNHLYRVFNSQTRRHYSLRHVYM